MGLLDSLLQEISPVQAGTVLGSLQWRTVLNCEVCGDRYDLRH